MCMKCVAAGKMKLVGETTEEEHKSYVLLSNKIQCGEKAANINVIPADADASKISAYLGAVINDLGVNKALMQEWFEKIARRFQVEDYRQLSYDDNDHRVFENTQCDCKG